MAQPRFPVWQPYLACDGALGSQGRSCCCPSGVTLSLALGLSVSYLVPRCPYLGMCCKRLRSELSCFGCKTVLPAFLESLVLVGCCHNLKLSFPLLGSVLIFFKKKKKKAKIYLCVFCKWNMSDVPLSLAAGNRKLLVLFYFLDRYLQLACPKSIVKMVIPFLIGI